MQSGQRVYIPATLESLFVKCARSRISVESKDISSRVRSITPISQLLQKAVSYFRRRSRSLQSRDMPQCPVECLKRLLLRGVRRVPHLVRDLLFSSMSSERMEDRVRGIVSIKPVVGSLQIHVRSLPGTLDWKEADHY